MISIRRSFSLFAALAFVGAMFAAEDDPFVGTWKLDLAKSTYSSNHPKPRELMVTIVDQGDNRLSTLHGTAADGSPIQMEVTAPIKGGPVELKGAPPHPSWDTVVSEYISPTAQDFVYSKGGKEVARRHFNVAEDHQTFTVRFTGPGPQSQTITQDDFWRRQ
ncbi:MAG: hypothetical protein JO182_21255 [Acidobacteriaceae bacterium]|nr:hypothetical protein [Acidobacteriaceae bacterium]